MCQWLRQRLHSTHSAPRSSSSSCCPEVAPGYLRRRLRQSTDLRHCNRTAGRHWHSRPAPRSAVPPAYSSASSALLSGPPRRTGGSVSPGNSSRKDGAGPQWTAVDSGGQRWTVRPRQWTVTGTALHGTQLVISAEQRTIAARTISDRPGQFRSW